MARVRFVLVVILLGAIVILAGGITTAHAISCGDILGPGGDFQLQQDLNCPGSFGVGLTVKDGAILDLNGHIVTCVNIGPCVLLSGIGAQLFDGALGGSLHEPLQLIGTAHTVKNVTTLPADGSVRVEGDNNRLINVTAGGGPSGAFFIRGNNNQLSDSIARCGNLFSEQACVVVSGDSNRLTDNFANVIGGGQFVLGNAFSINGNNNNFLTASPNAVFCLLAALPFLEIATA